MSSEPYTAQFFTKVDEALARSGPVILSWEFAQSLRQELELVAKQFANACSLRHDWRPARAGDFTTPHQTCRNCRKDRPTPMSTGGEGA